MIMWPALRCVACFLSLDAVLSSCTQSAPDHGPPLSVCRAHLSGVVAARASTVREVTEVGPRPIPAVRGHLGKYYGISRVSLCLVPGAGSDEFVAVAITPDGSKHVMWRQSGGGKRFMFPS
jgi:hypothetical protein